MDVQRNLESSLEKHTKEIYGPPVGKKMVVFIDDMNMPQVDTYGTQQPIALLKLLLEKGGMYDRGKELNWKIIKDISYYAAMGKSGGGRNEVDPRFVSMFSVFNMTFPSDATVTHIYLSILRGHLGIFPDDVRELAPNVIAATLYLYKAAVNELPPTPSKFHYIFNLRDLSRIVAGLLLTAPAHYQQPQLFVKVWRNEFTRVICDRLINDADQKLMSDNMLNAMLAYFPEHNVYAMTDPLLYGDYRNALSEDEPRDYEDLIDYEAIYCLFSEILNDYNERNLKMNLVLFEDALEHLTRIHRVLRMNPGHSMVVGVGGSGKQSLVRLAAYSAGNV
ncbi:hypothetical protein AAG570_005373 [Ranatra chinensis]|uniref:Dynein heavy chain n=1 Tax=Ranatra chinensis TaxID=642074 RepID=A0ABD0Y090_9HEMI